MWIWILIFGLVCMIFIWRVLAGTQRDDAEDEAQIEAIKQWKRKREQ